MLLLVLFSQTNLAQFVQVEILDDDVSGEPDQLYDLNIINVPSGVLLGRDVTTIVIDDDDREQIILIHSIMSYCLFLLNL